MPVGESAGEQDGLEGVCLRRIRPASHLDLAKKDSESSSMSGGSNCSLSSLTGARQVAFIRRSTDTPFRAVSLPEALADSNEGCALALCMLCIQEQASTLLQAPEAYASRRCDSALAPFPHTHPLPQLLSTLHEAGLVSVGFAL